MRGPLAPDEEVVFREFTRLDVEPNQIPAELFEGFVWRVVNMCWFKIRRKCLEDS